MLVLTRKLMERLYIGEDICVTVVRLEGSQVRLGIEAPRQVPVVRAELKRHERPAKEVVEAEVERVAVPSGLATRSARLRGQVVRE